MATDLPTSIPQSVEWLLAHWPEKVLEAVRLTPAGDLIEHHLGFGLRIRNELDLWNERSELLEACRRDNAAVHPDDASPVGLEAFRSNSPETILFRKIGLQTVVACQQVSNEKLLCLIEASIRRHKNSHSIR